MIKLSYYEKKINYLEGVNNDLKKAKSIEERNEVLKKRIQEVLKSRNFSYIESYKTGEEKDFENFDLPSHLSRQEHYEFDQEIVWRGDDPETILSGNTVKLESNFNNVADTYKVSISYYGGMKNEETQWLFNASVGFLPKHGSLKEGNIVEHDSQDVLDSQKGMMVFNGDIEPDDIKYVMVRAHGLKPGEVGETHVFKKNKTA